MGRRGCIRRALCAALLLVAALAAAGGIVLERVVVAPAAARLAASYVTLPLGASATQALVVAVGLAALALAAAAWVARGAVRDPIVVGLREE